MPKFFVNELKEDNYDDNIQNRLGYYFVAYKNDDNEEVNDTDDVVNELNIPLKEYIRICKNNGSVGLKDCIDDYDDYEDLFINPYNAAVALQELLEFSIQFHKSQCGCECDCKKDSIKIPTFPESFENNSVPKCIDIEDEMINDFIQDGIYRLEDCEENTTIEIATGNTVVILSKNYMVDENDEKCMCDNFYYNVKVCKNYYEYESNTDFCHECVDNEDLLFFKE